MLPDALVTPPADLPDAFPFMLRDVAHETLPFAPEPAFVDDQDGDSPGEPAEPQFTPVIEADDSSGFTPASPDPDEAPISEPETPAGEILESPEPETEPESQTETGIEEERVDDPAEVVEPVPPSGKRGRSKRSKQPTTQVADDIAYPGPPARPPGRIRPGVRPASAATDASSGSGIRNAQITPAVVVAMALGLIALGLFLWSLLLLGRVGDLEDEIAQQNEEIATLRQQANATAYTLAPTSAGPSGASGLFLFSLPDQRGALVIRGLEPAPNEWAYQIWFIDDDEPAPIAGPTFQVDENGEAVVPLTAEVATFDAVAISLEPAGGSSAPTSQVILQGRLGGAAG